MTDDKNVIIAREQYWNNKLSAIAPKATCLVEVEAIHAVGGSVRYILIGASLDGTFTTAQLRAIADTLDEFSR